MSVSVAIAGASGYAGGELLRLLANHPEFSVRTVTANSNAGERVRSVHPHLQSYGELRFVDTTAEVLDGHDVVFTALPHGHSGALTDALPEETVVVDCAADHRLRSENDWAQFYGGQFHEPWAYGLPELLAAGAKQRETLRGTRRIAAPGCNASAVTLALAPGIAAGVFDPADLVSTLAVGSSGAGRAARVDLLAAELVGSAKPYSVGGAHRHIPEILQSLRGAGATSEPSLSFTPVLVPMARGILATNTARLTAGASAAAVADAFAAAYADEPFVQVLESGEFPRSGDAVGSNSCLIGINVDETSGRVTVISALDNLIKGTAGAAVQCANLAFGFDETLGLTPNGVAP